MRLRMVTTHPGIAQYAKQGSNLQPAPSEGAALPIELPAYQVPRRGFEPLPDERVDSESTASAVPPPGHIKLSVHRVGVEPTRGRVKAGGSGL